MKSISYFTSPYWWFHRTTLQFQTLRWFHRSSRPSHLVRCSWLWEYSRTPLIRPPSESHWCGRIRGMVAREGFVYEQNAQSVTRNVVVCEGWSLVRVVVRQGFYCRGISLVGRETLLAGVVGSCVSTVGAAISYAVLTHTGGVQRRVDSSQSRGVGTRGQDYKRFSSMDWCSTHNLCSEMT